MSIDKMVNRREESALATRTMLLASARAVFGERGFADASLTEIARNAKATTGALYHHFANKKTLFAVVAEEIEAGLVEHLAASAPQTDDLWEIVNYAIIETLNQTARPGIATVIFKDAPTVLGASAWHEIEMRYGFGKLHALLSALSASGRLAAYDPAIVASIFLGSTIQIVEAILTSAQPSVTLKAGRSAMLALLRAFRE